MANLKLAKLPDRKPVRITITVSADLHALLQAYAATYRETYGDSEEISELVPYMVEQFLSTDRGFAKARREREPASDGRTSMGSSRTVPKRRDSQSSTVS